MDPIFVLLVVLMTGLAVCLVALPVLRSRKGAEEGSSHLLSAGVLLVIVPLIVLLSYPRLSNFDWSSLKTAQTVRTATNEVAGSAGGADDIVESLAQRLRAQGGSLEEWRLLGRSYFNLTRYDGAEAAFREAYRESTGEAPAVVAEVAAEYAEAMILNDGRALLAEAGALLEKSLDVLPDQPRALWWGGLAAFERGEYATAQTRWVRLQSAPEMADQERMRAELQTRIAMAEQLAANNAPPPAQIRAAMEAAGAAAPPASQSDVPAAAGGRSLQVRVELDPTLGDGLSDEQVLFIIARSPGGGGPPLAVVRRSSSQLPLDVSLSDADAMIPGRGISSVNQVEVVARLSASGNPIAAPGDLWGSEQVDGDEDAPIVVTIDQVTR